LIYWQEKIDLKIIYSSKIRLIKHKNIIKTGSDPDIIGDLDV